ncbi:Gas vesicle protein [Alloiococcus otitis]|uniref:YtxH domain-containing protein n=1 Tax=Alloiococcus otitis ATCC 51267 TaxID=883081 RepID=K9E970_9LACT|nr:YtxH domain-containing protein [Alloiococcus otitis]EKU93774.1 hypothetical protein HMPREF9698_00722 [Alloiococcus otitis ATCC 51267]SUU80202.1 Gas vesicle protein [Alloiococcus otitis]
MPKVSLSKTIFLTAGAALGALLFAPKSGKELRKDLKKEAKRLGGEAKVYANNLKDDFDEAYQEAKVQAQEEKEEAAKQEEELARTIAEIEQELEERDQVTRQDDQGDLNRVPDNVLEDLDLGDTKNTSQEPHQDQVVPRGELDEALDDQDLEDDPSFQANPE